MSQCVPNWDLDDASPTRFDLRPHPSTSTSTSSAPYVPMLDYEMAELTWENGQLSMHGLGLRRLCGKPNLSSSPNLNHKYAAWERPRAATAGTLESIVNLATQKPRPHPPPAACAQSSSHCDDDGVDLVPCFGGSSKTQHHQSSGGGEAAPATMDALVPCQAAKEEGRTAPRSLGISTCVVGSSTRVDSCSGAGGAACEQTRAVEDGDQRSVRKKARLAPRVPVAAGEWSKDQSVSISGTFAGDSWHVPTVDTCERELGGVGFTLTSFCSQGNTLSSSGRPCTNNTTTVDDHDSVCHSRPQRETGTEEGRKKGNAKSSSSNRRSRAAAIHNQSERKRRDKINQKMKTLQKLVPNSNKTDKASMLDDVIDYLKQLQAQVHMMSRMSGWPSMMMPQLAMQQQLQMSMMAAAAAPMGMGMGFGMGMGMGMAMPGSIGMDMNMNMNMNIHPMARQGGGLPQPVLNPTAVFMPLAAAWDANNANAASHNRLPSQPVPATAVVPTDPISTFLACQPQPVTIEAYSRMIAMIQQQQQLTSTSKH